MTRELLRLWLLLAGCRVLLSMCTEKTPKARGESVRSAGLEEFSDIVQVGRLDLMAGRDGSSSGESDCD